MNEAEPLTNPELRRLGKMFILLCATITSGWIGCSFGREKITAQVEVSPIHDDLHDAEEFLDGVIERLKANDANVKGPLRDALDRIRHAERFARKITNHEE